MTRKQCQRAIWTRLFGIHDDALWPAGPDKLLVEERDGAGEEPEVPPPVLAEDEASDGGRVLEDHAGGGALGGDVEGGGGPEGIAGEEDGFAVGDLGDVIVDG